MFIAVPARDCRIAVTAAITAITAKRDEDRNAIEDKAYNSLYNGAVHNGLKPTLDDIQKMRDMAKRDVEHMMEHHQSVELLGQLGIYSRMLDANKDSEIALDAQSFELVGEYLPKADAEEQAA